MKNYLLLVFFAFPCLAQSQTLDTTSARLVIDSLIGLNNSLTNDRKFDDALDVILQAEEIGKDAFGEENALYVEVIFKVGETYHRRNELGPAEKFYLKAKVINERTAGRDNSIYISTLYRLGRLYRSLQKNDKAEESYLEAKEILLNSKQEQKEITYTRVLNVLGILYWEMGLYNKAEKAHVEALELLENISAVTSRYYAMNLNNLASLYQENLKQLEKAEAILIRALNLWEEVAGKDDSRYATVLHNLANLYRQQRKFDEAEPRYLEALAIRKDMLGAEHPHYALSLYNMGTFYREQNLYDQAESFYLDAKDIRERVLGKDHPEYAESLHTLAILYSRMGHYDKVEPLHLELYANRKNHIDNAFSFLSEKDKEQNIQNNIEKYMDCIQSAALHYQSPGMQDLQYDIALLMKGIRLQAGQSTLNYVLQQQDSVALETYQQLLELRHRLNAQYNLPIADRQHIKELEAEQEEKEKMLARLSAAFRLEQAIANITGKEVQAALKTGEAAVEFVHFKYRLPYGKDSIMYAAVVLLPDATHAQFIPLFEEEELDGLLLNPGELKLDYVANLYATASRGFVPDEAKGPSLYELIWQPLDSLLFGVETLFYSSSGLLHRLNLEAIPVDEDMNIADKYRLHALSSTRLLAIPSSTENILGQDALIYGGIRYDYDSMAISEALADLDSISIEYDVGDAFGYTDRSLRSAQLNYLKWSEKEGNSIHQLLTDNDYRSELWKGYRATEESLKRIGTRQLSPRILHLSTHGYFFPDPDSLPVEGVEQVFKWSDHPMIRSGLILAGANRVWQGAEPLPGREDGILTAFEISHLNLTNTELVVLSACETGLGDIQGNEGVFGLQRAFKMAGAKYLIMSLWQVNDFATQKLMVTFYTKWLEEEIPIPDAFKAAQRELREQYQDPYFWAGFVLLE